MVVKADKLYMEKRRELSTQNTSFVSVAHFIFIANDKPTSGKQIILIETIFLCPEGN